MKCADYKLDVRCFFQHIIHGKLIFRISDFRAGDDEGNLEFKVEKDGQNIVSVSLLVSGQLHVSDMCSVWLM